MSLTGNTTFLRIASAVVALPVYLFLIITESFHSIPILIVSLIISLLSLYEYYRITDRGEEGRAFVKVGIFSSVIINIVIYLFAYGKVYGYTKYIKSFDARVILFIVILSLFIILVLQVFKRPIKGGIYSVSVTFFGIIFFALSFSHIILIKALSDGVFYLLILNAIVMLNDIGAYFGGIFFGRHKTGFEVSPNKSWEGYFSGLLFSVIGMLVINQVCLSFFNRKFFNIVESAFVGIGIGILGSVGDLVESAVKRDSSIKDSGSIIPGHGGMWDVFDAMIFTAPLYYYFLVIIGVP